MRSWLIASFVAALAEPAVAQSVDSRIRTLEARMAAVESRLVALEGPGTAHPAAGYASKADDTGVQMVRDIEIASTGCVQRARTLTCAFLLSNAGGAPARIKFYANHFAGRSRAILPDGSELIAGQVSIGSQTSSRYVEQTLQPALPTRATVIFEMPAAGGATLRPDRLAGLELTTETGGGGALFRNVAVNQE